MDSTAEGFFQTAILEGAGADSTLALADGCVDCHVPALPSATILSTSGGETLRPRVRTHRIGVHAERGAG